MLVNYNNGNSDDSHRNLHEIKMDGFVINLICNMTITLVASHNHPLES
jgi:hypothetical protein